MRWFLTRQFLASAGSSVPLYIVSVREMDELWVRCEKQLFALRSCCNSHSDDGFGDCSLLGSGSCCCAVLCRKAGGRSRHTSPPKLSSARALCKPPLYLQRAPYRTTGQGRHQCTRSRGNKVLFSHKSYPILFIQRF